MQKEISFWPLIDFQKMSKREIGDYFAEFTNAVPEQLQRLHIDVNRTPGFDTWRADETADSLLDLGKWLSTHTETRMRTPEELNAIKSRLTMDVPISRRDLTDLTIARAARVGIYLAATLHRNHPDTKWTYHVTPRNLADYGQPILSGFPNVDFNPVRIGVVLARGVADGKRGADRLAELYAFWSRQAPTS